MQVKFSEDVVSLSDLKINPGKIVNQTKDNRRPVLLTSRGKGIAVVQGLEEYEKTQEKNEFMKAITQGLMDIKQGNVQDLDDIKKKLDIL
jgi:prevent-host-death family protein